MRLSAEKPGGRSSGRQSVHPPYACPPCARPSPALPDGFWRRRVVDRLAHDGRIHAEVSNMQGLRRFPTRLLVGAATILSLTGLVLAPAVSASAASGSARSGDLHEI